MAEFFHNHRKLLFASAIVVLLLMLRLFFLAYFPLYDTTEARYAEIARIMFETSNWVTPQIDYQQPFWGKPPGHTWMSAGSFVVLGVSGFAARLPHFLCGIGILWLVYLFARDCAKQNQENTRESGFLAVLVLISSIGFFIAMGMVMTDIALTMSTTMAMISFWKAWCNDARWLHGHVFFAALALGMLIKGPVALVLVGISLVLWSLWQKNLFSALQVLPWVSGLLLFFALTLPWYIWAEIRTPGFLEYFIVGEHFQRFVVSGWEGDLYGNAHDKPRGMIWLFWLVAAFPWSFLLLAKLWEQHKNEQVELTHSSRTLSSYLLCWVISPMMLFTLAGNILMAYVLPGFAAMAVLYSLHSRLNRTNLAIAGTCLSVFLLAVPAKQMELITKTSEVELIGDEPAQYANSPVVYWQKRPFSASFYSAGQAQLIDKYDTLETMASGPETVFIAAEFQHFDTLYGSLSQVCTEHAKTKDRFLLRCGNNNEALISRRQQRHR